ncbi:MAG: O-antigen ligase family protein [Chloroflexota bacterium]
MQPLFQRLLKLEIWIVTAAVLAGFVSAPLLPLGAITAAAFCLLRCLALRRVTVRTAADWPILGLLAMIPVTLWATALPEVTIPQVYRLLSGIGLYYAIANAPAGQSSLLSGPSHLRGLVRFFGLAALGLAAFAFISVDWGVTGKLPFIPAGLYARLPRLVSDTANPNVLGGSLLLLLALVLALLLFGGRRLRVDETAVFGAALALGAGVLVLTQSRGALLAFGLCFLLLIALRWRRGWLFVALSAAGLAVSLPFIGATPLVNLLVSSATLGGIDGRIEVWSRAVYMIQDFPFTGVGMGSYGRVADLLYPFFLYAPGKVTHAHNLLLQIAVDLGIPGLICWLAAWMLVLATAWQVYRCGRRRQDAWLAGLGAGLVACQVALIVHGMVDAVTWGMVRPAPIVWALWGLTAAAAVQLSVAQRGADV